MFAITRVLLYSVVGCLFFCGLYKTQILFTQNLTNFYLFMLTFEVDSEMVVLAGL